MANTRRLGRLGMLAVGLGVGAAMASGATASADSGVADPFNWISGLDLPSAAAGIPTDSALDLDISVDGYTLLDLGTGASAFSDTGDIAIAFGDGSTAIAHGSVVDQGFGDVAIATAGGTAVAGATERTAGSETGSSNFDFASANGVGSTANAGGFGSFDYASADSGASADAGTNGSGDSATAVGQGAIADAGMGNSTDSANFDSASVLGNLTTPTADVSDATGGSSDTSFVIDPLGTVGSSALAGNTGDEPGFYNFDLAGVFGDDLHAFANTASNVVEILPSLFGDSAAATDIGSFLTDIFSGLAF